MFACLCVRFGRLVCVCWSACVFALVCIAWLRGSCVFAWCVACLIGCLVAYVLLDLCVVAFARCVLCACVMLACVFLLLGYERCWLSVSVVHVTGY